MGQKAKTKRGTPEYIEKMRAAGKKGGATTLKLYGPEHFAKAGREGGKALLAQRGREFFSQIGSMSPKKHEEDTDVQTDS